MIQNEKSKMPHFRAFSVYSYILLGAEKNIKQVNDLNIRDYQEIFASLTRSAKLTILNSYDFFFFFFSCIFAEKEYKDENKIRKSNKFI